MNPVTVETIAETVLCRETFDFHGCGLSGKGMGNVSAPSNSLPAFLDRFSDTPILTVSKL